MTRLKDENYAARWACAHHTPRNNEELWLYIRTVYGFDIPRLPHPTQPDHDTPFDMIADAFFERHDSIIAMGDRGSGKTRNFSILIHLNSTHKPGCWTTHLGAIEKQASRCHTYLKGLTNISFFEGEVIDTLAKEIAWHNTSRAEILPGTITSASGPHPHKAHFDEVEWAKSWDIVQQFVFMPMTDDNIKGQLIYGSTRQKIYGPMNKLMLMARQMGLHVIQWNVWDVMESCYDCDGKECFMWNVCQGKMHLPTKRGWRKKVDVLRDFRNADEEAWLTQHECMLPGTRGLVYANFDAILNGGHLRYEPYLPLYGSFDYGYNDPTSFNFIQRTPDGSLLHIDEIYIEGKTATQIADLIKQKPYWQFIQYIYADPRQAGQNKELQNALGIPVEGVVCPLDESIQLMRRIIRDNSGGRSYRVDSEMCPMTMIEFTLYHMPETGGDKPIDKDNHSMDNIRYLIWAQFTDYGTVTTEDADIYDEADIGMGASFL